MTVIRVKAVLFFVFILFFAAVAQDVDSQNNRAQEIVKKAKAAVGKKTDLASAKTFTVSYESSGRIAYQDKILEANAKVEVNLSGFDKIRASKSIQHFSNGKHTNNEKQEFVLNGDGFFFDTKVFGISGEKIDFNAKTDVDKDQMKKSFRDEIFYLFFPLALDASWYFPMNFSYVGVAESKDGKAEVLELTAPNKTIYRLFFDAKTYLLLMMTEIRTNEQNKSFEKKYFYSDYQEKDGLLAATKIVVESNGKVVEEREIKSLKINPTFKPNFFDVK
ncbi:MAG: hypothetical protein C4287_23145 [Leptolyngbya sp. ERB_1_2]